MAAAIGRVEAKLVRAELRDAHDTLDSVERVVQAALRPKLADLSAAIHARNALTTQAAAADIDRTMAALRRDEPRSTACTAQLNQDVADLKEATERAVDAFKVAARYQ